MKTMPTCLLAAVCAVAPIGVTAADDEKKPVPLYTNDDLRRMRPYRDQTGVNSTPSTAAAEPAAGHEGTRGEEYWRREAERLRDRLRPLRERAAELRMRIEERRRRPRAPLGGDPQVGAMEQRLAVVEQRIREAESRLEDRVRRERAMPGWIR